MGAWTYYPLRTIEIYHRKSRNALKFRKFHIRYALLVDAAPIPIELRCLQPFRTELIRLGSPFDGGYAVPAGAIKEVKSCISIGLGRNWSFEKCLKDQFGINQIIVYDGSVGLFTFTLDSVAAFRDFMLGRRKFATLKKNFLFCFQYLKFFRKSVTHKKKMIVGASADKSQLSIESVLNQIREPEETIFKIDIEGDEYRLSRQLLNSTKFIKIRIVIMEWHETDRHRDKFLEFVNEMAETHYLIHLHENNCSPLAYDLLPVTLELVWQSKEIEVLKDRVEKLPLIGVDSPNKNSKPTHSFSFP